VSRANPATARFALQKLLSKAMQCSICLDDIEGGPTLACGHRFHASCLARLAGANGTTPTRRGALTACPNCRTVSRHQRGRRRGRCFQRSRPTTGNVSREPPKKQTASGPTTEYSPAASSTTSTSTARRRSNTRSGAPRIRIKYPLMLSIANNTNQC
jgi:hypothetical protein